MVKEAKHLLDTWNAYDPDKDTKESKQVPKMRWTTWMGNTNIRAEEVEGEFLTLKNVLLLLDTTTYHYDKVLVGPGCLLLPIDKPEEEEQA